MNTRMLDGIPTSQVNILLNFGILHHRINEDLANRKVISRIIKLDIIMLWLVHCATCSLMDLQRKVKHCVMMKKPDVILFSSMVSVVLIVSSMRTRLANSSKSPSVEDFVMTCSLMR